jgi:multimeric flavodoxin WrbA
MKVLGICGSPRAGGNTDTLINKVLEGAASAGAIPEKITLDKLKLSPIKEEEYENISPEGLSVVNDDIHAVFKKIQECDALVIASPIFFGSLSAQAKMMIDRFQCVWLANNIRNMNIFSKKIQGAFLCVEATQREDFFENARSIVRHFFATINADYKEELFCPGLDRKGSVLEKQDYLEKAYELGRRMAGGE